MLLRLLSVQSCCQSLVWLWFEGLFEGLQLRVRDFNFGVNVLTIHGKGKKNRTVPLPESILPELKAVGELHEKYLTAGYDVVFLDDAVETKYPRAPKEFIHQWFFPMRTLTVADNGERRRYHLHESDLQRALYYAVSNVKIPKKVTSHIFRHSFVTHLLQQAGYDIRVIQTLLRAYQLENDNDLHALRSGQDGKRAEEPARFLSYYLFK